MNNLIVIFLIFVAVRVQAASPQHMYWKVDQIQSVAEWLDAAERGVSTVKLEEKIDKDSNLMISIVKQVARPEGMISEEYKAFILAHTQKFMSLVTVERNKMRLYFGAAPNKRAEYSEGTFEDYIHQSTSQPHNFYEIQSIMEGLNYNLSQIHGVAPLSLKENLNGLNSLRVGSYTLVRMDFNEDVTPALLEDFLILVWSMVEKDMPYPRFKISGTNSCSDYLGKHL